MMVVVSYDVATTTKEGRRRLRYVAKECCNFGQRVQNSVFECVLDPEQWTRLKLRLLGIVDLEEDSLRFYYLGSRWKGHVEHYGAKRSIDVDGPLIA